MSRIARWALPVIALVGLVATACTPVKQQFGKNILGYTISNGCLPGIHANAEPLNIYRSPSPNFSREVCSGGFAGHSVGPQGVTLQVVNSSSDVSSAGFITGGLNQLGDINSLKISQTGGSNTVFVELLLDKNNDGQFLCPPDATGKSTGFCGDAIALISPGVGFERVYLNDDQLLLYYAPCVPATGCLQQPPSFVAESLENVKKGAFPGIDGFTKTLISVGVFGTDAKSTVTGFELNGVQYLP